MTIRLMVSIAALPGKGGELAKLRAPRAAEVRLEPGCEQFELFQSTENPDQLVLLEKWTDEASLAAHSKRNQERPQVGTELRAGASVMERYVTE
ncbi:MAG: hypothetical protein EXR58_03570 [Chloroflexi bacterium]|nr:hypothetical protein [Chloroflexota bacterium]